jgi:hypothetical protein
MMPKQLPYSGRFAALLPRKQKVGFGCLMEDTFGTACTFTSGGAWTFQADPDDDRQCRRAHYTRDDFPRVHSITSSARARREGGMARPRTFAAFMLMTSSKTVGCSTGRSAGLAPFRMRST